MRLVDADELKKKAFGKRGGLVHTRDIDDAPTVDAVPVVHGRWIDLSPQGDNRFMCTVCKWKENVPTCMGEPTIWDFCPSCGARMDGKKSVYGERKDHETD